MSLNIDEDKIRAAAVDLVESFVVSNKRSQAIVTDGMAERIQTIRDKKEVARIIAETLTATYG